MQDNQHKNKASEPSSKITVPVPGVAQSIDVKILEAAAAGIPAQCDILFNAVRKAQQSWPKKEHRNQQGARMMSDNAFIIFSHEWRNGANNLYHGLLCLQHNEPIPDQDAYLQRGAQGFLDKKESLDALREMLKAPLGENHLTPAQQQTALQALDTIEAISAKFCHHVDELRVARVDEGSQKSIG